MLPVGRDLANSPDQEHPKSPTPLSFIQSFRDAPPFRSERSGCWGIWLRRSARA